MPVERKGFFFSHFEKVICAVVGVGILLALAYMSRRSGGQEITAVIEKIDQALTRINKGQKTPPPLLELSDYRKEWVVAGDVRPPAEITKERFWYPWPPIYPVHEVGTGKPYVLTFFAPLTYGTVKVENELPAEGVIDHIEHPAEGSYMKVKVYTKERKERGFAKIVGMAGRRKHIRPIIVDPNILPPAEPPLGLKAVAQRDGVLLTFEPNPKNKEAAGVTHYEIWRKPEADIVGEFVQVGQVASTERGAGAPGAGAGGAPMPGPGGGFGVPGGGAPAFPAAGGPGGGAAAGAGAAKKTTETAAVTYSFRDAFVQQGVLLGDPRLLTPDEGYVYKVRTFAAKAYNKVSDFTPEVRVRTWPTVDFQFVRIVGRRVVFKVGVCDLATGAVRRAEFKNEIGEEIGGEMRRADTGEPVVFLTGCFLLDFQQGVKRPDGKPPIDDCIIYMNRHSQVEARWRNDGVADYIWKEAAPAGPTAPGPGGPGMPMPGVPHPGAPGPGMPGPGPVPEYLTPTNP